MSVCVFILRRPGPAWLWSDSVSHSVGRMAGRAHSHMGFHFISLHYIYGSPDAPIHCKWQGFIWSTQVMEAIRESPLSYKHLWPPGTIKHRCRHTPTHNGTHTHTCLKRQMWLHAAIEEWAAIEQKEDGCWEWESKDTVCFYNIEDD